MRTNRQLRVCIVSPLFHPSLGGISRQALALAKKLTIFGVNALVVTRRLKGMPKDAVGNHIPIFKAWCIRPYKINLTEMSLLNFLTSLSFCLSTAWILLRHRNKYDIVHFHGASLPLITNIPLLKLLDKKIVARVAGAKNHREAGSLRGKYLFLGTMLVLMLKKVDAFINISEDIKSDLIKEGYDQDKVISISSFVEQNIFYPSNQKEREKLREKFGYTHTRVVTYTGRLAESKGIRDLLQAWVEINKVCNDTLLVIIGDGPLKEDLKRQCHVLGIYRNVKFTGYVRNIREYLVASDIFVLPSYREGFPNSLLEAMACGVPVLSTNISGVVDVIKHGENGLVFEPGNVGQLSAALKKLIQDTDYAAALGKAAHKGVQKKFDLNAVADKYVRLYCRLLQ